MDQAQRYRNFFANVSHIHIKPSCPEETIKELAIAAKNVENKVYDLTIPSGYISDNQ